MSAGFVLLCGLGLDGGDRDLRRALTRGVYGMLCVMLFLSLVGTKRHWLRSNAGSRFLST